jgi:osmotically-inducible protein OsmY
MSKWKFNLMGGALILTGTLSAWAATRDPSNVGNPDDAQINADVTAAIARHPDLGAPNQIYIQTLDHVVYLSGWVSTDLSADDAIEIAGKIPGVTRVVSTIAVDE